MKSLFYASLFISLLSGCASYHEKNQVSANNSNKSSQREKVSTVSGKGAVWELFSPEKVVLHFKNVDNELPVSLILNKGINNHFLNPGHWELSGFDLDGISYRSMNVSKKFVLKIRAGISTYSGSLLTGCPRVSKKESQFLKKMKFFDRYPFSSSVGLCELVVGDNKENVQKRLRKEKKFKSLNLQSGF
jgi:hypothetical protein